MSKPINKSDLVDALASKLESSKADAESFLNALQSVIIDSLKRKLDITLVGFLGFKVAHKPAGTARNPRTGAEIKVAAKNIVKVKAGKNLTDAVN